MRQVSRDYCVQEAVYNHAEPPHQDDQRQTVPHQGHRTAIMHPVQLQGRAAEPRRQEVALPVFASFVHLAAWKVGRNQL